MLEKSMTLKEIITFEPDDLKMAELPLDVILYLKGVIVSYQFVDNYDLIRFFFQNEEFKDFFKAPESTLFLDFDGSKTAQERVVTAFELYGLKPFQETADYLKELFASYDHQADFVLDIFTHDNKKYRLSDLDGIIAIEPLNS